MVMTVSTYPQLAKHASSIGLLVDRCVRGEQPFGTVWLIDTDKVATCAHHVVLYREFLNGLKVRFPAMGQEWEIVDAQFHPRFDIASAHEMAQRSLSAPVPALALQDHNMVILKLARSLSDLDPQAATTFNKKIALTPLPRLKGLAGAVEELGLALVIQTMANARKEGVLLITDERNRPVARVFYRDGRMVYAKFGKLHNEQAIYQMFAQNVGGQFNFRTQSQPDWTVTEPMNRPTDGLLLEAHRRMDEVPRLLEQLGSRHAAYKRVTELLTLEPIAEEWRNAASVLWPHLDGGVSIDQLWDVVNMDDYSVYSALVELKRTGQVSQMPENSEALAPFQPLETGAHLPLSPWDDIVSVSVDNIAGRAQMRTGSLVGLLRPNDPYHLLHTLSLPYLAAGSPLFKNGLVVGMHCGMLPLDPTLHALPHQLHQMLWVESARVCMEATGKAMTNKKSVGMQKPDMSAALVQSGAGRKRCPKCNSTMVKEARFCGVCGQSMT